MSVPEKDILAKIDEVRNQDVELYSYLYDLFYLEISTNHKFLERIYGSFLNDERTSIKAISLYGLLFFLKSRNLEYKSVAVNFSKDSSADLVLRLRCLGGLGEAYKGTRDENLIALSMNLYKNKEEDSDIRAESFIALMKLMGMSSVDILSQNSNVVIIEYDDINEDLFLDKIEEARNLMTL